MSENAQVKIFVLPGGRLPKRMTSGSVGFDARIRAVVSPTETDPANPNLRKTLFDFRVWPEDPLVERHVHVKQAEEGNQLMYRMEPNERVLVGVGFLTQMQFPMFYWVLPRSGLASKYGILVSNAPGTVDPDYRGEAGVIVDNRNQHSFDLFLGMRIAQIVFMPASIPELVVVESVEGLEETRRGSGGFGSTGIR
ncbi:MAG: hypothetical protein A2934_05805 [Candidatus Sungbacteria bacterium RIFCSPLOWO2_01_FULL_47_10]|uniref:dUTP diphosphatase n=1 Tax=Candidatus Sungbacteria bacterium RIFCSPLOWO2_01_FULL_47_10 TaxID=1802276 RepID=A0A1G2L7Z9_9BACT|nr:MAG: hypothetical protein A2934_05805 [Candidatus Sungbacteria bacterium RIFCSPLOWO2_01_FULL_47_10]